jgi:hypothetical protein
VNGLIGGKIEKKRREKKDLAFVAAFAICNGVKRKEFEKLGITRFHSLPIDDIICNTSGRELLALSLYMYVQ